MEAGRKHEHFIQGNSRKQKISICIGFAKYKSLSWLVWLSGLSASLQTKKLPVGFPVRAHACVAGQVPNKSHGTMHGGLCDSRTCSGVGLQERDLQFEVPEPFKISSNPVWPFPWRETLSLSSKAICYINIVEKMVCSRVSECLHVQEVQHQERPKDNSSKKKIEGSSIIKWAGVNKFIGL